MAKNVLFSVSAGSLGHVLRMIALDQILLKSNIKTYWILDGYYSNYLKGYVNYIDIIPFFKHKGKVRDSRSLAELFWRKGHDILTVEILKQRIKQLLIKYKIELVINDIILATALASYELSIPCINVINDAQFSICQNNYYEDLGIYEDIAEFLSKKPFIHAIPSIKEWYFINNSKDPKDAIFLGWLYPNRDIGFFSPYNSNQQQIQLFGKQINSKDFRKDIYFMGDVLAKTKYIIHNSGLNTCLTALAFKTYSFLVPQTWEQEINANKMVSIGAGELYTIANTTSCHELKTLSNEADELSNLLLNSRIDHLVKSIINSNFSKNI
ncbi:MAG: hypothetical protein WC375_09360 [Methanomassiliicoccales archaeon]|jgi:hypothetical protein